MSPSQETQNAVADAGRDRDIAELKRGVETLMVQVKAMQAERDRALWWGIYSLGLAVVGMAIWIVNLFAGGHIK